MAQNPPIKTAVIGYGLSAKIFHIPFIEALPALFTLHGIVQRTPTPSDSAAANHPDAVIYHDATEAFADPAIDLVVVTSIPSTHFTFCKQALEAGKHVICEKPFVPTSEEATTLATLAQSSGKVLSVYQNRRWDADFLTLQQLVTSGALGPLAELETHFDRHRPKPPVPSGGGAVSWKAQGGLPANGAIYDLGTHLLDQVLVLCGTPTRITAFLTNQRVYESSGTGEDAGGDSFTVLLHYDDASAGPLLVTAKAGVVSPQQTQLRFWARGEKASFYKLGMDVQEDQLRAGVRPLKDADVFGIEPESQYGVVTRVAEEKGTGATVFGKEVCRPQGPPDTYLRFYQRVADAIYGDAPNPVPAEDGARVIRLIELCKESNDTGRTVNWS